MKIVRFKSLFDFNKKSNLKASENDENGKYPFYTSSSVISKKTNTPLYSEKSLIIGNGGSANIHFAEIPFSTTSHCYVATAKNKDLNIKYVYYYLLSNIYILERGFKGAGLKNISSKYIDEIEIPLPDFATQEKIVTVLDKAESLIKKRERTIILCDSFLKNIFLEKFKVFEGKEIEILDNVANVTSGLTKGKKNLGKKTRLVPYMRVANVQEGYLNLNEIKEIEATEDEITRFNLEKNDLLLTEGGDPDKLGRGTLWRDQIKGCIFQNHIFRVRIKAEDKLNPTFLSYQTGSIYGKRYFLKIAKQTTGIASINSTQLKNFPVYIPPLHLQIEFANIVEKTEIIKNHFQKSLRDVKTLFNSLSQSAFTGELRFNTAVDLEVLLENDYAYFKDKADKKAIQLLLDRLDKDELNENKFYEQEIYDKAKAFVFELLKEEKIKQVFDIKTKTLKLKV